MNAKMAILVLLGVSTTVSAGDERMRIVDEGRLSQVYVPVSGTQSTAPAYPAAYANAGDDVCIALGYTIQPDGSTGDFQLLRAWSSDRQSALTDDRYLDAFAAAAADSISRWRFVSGAAADGRPVMTVATLTFEGHGRVKKLADRCRIQELASYYRVSSEGGHGWLLAKRNGQHVSDLMSRMAVSQSSAQWISDHHR